MDVRTYPDPVLTRPCAPVTVFDEALRERIAGMWETMYAEKGVGLAAPQVGWDARVLVLNPAAEREQDADALTVVNPRLVKKWGRATAEEGCLSFPGIFVDVTRPRGVRVRYHDGHGTEHELELDDFRARIVQHEMDHLEGVLLYHRMSPVDKIRYRAELEELRAAYEERGVART